MIKGIEANVGEKIIKEIKAIGQSQRLHLAACLFLYENSYYHVVSCFN